MQYFKLSPNTHCQRREPGKPWKLSGLLGWLLVDDIAEFAIEAMTVIETGETRQILVTGHPPINLAPEDDGVVASKPRAGFIGVHLTRGEVVALAKAVANA